MYWKSVQCPSSFDGLVSQAHILEREPEVDPTRLPAVMEMEQCIQFALPVQSCVCIPRTTIELPIYGPLPRAVVVIPPSPDVYQVSTRWSTGMILPWF